MQMVAVIQLALEPDWYRLEQSQRVLYRSELARIVTSRPEVNCRWFDSEPWTGKIAEFFFCEFDDLHHYWRFWNELREHDAFRLSYLKVLRVSLGARRQILQDKLT